MGLFTLAVWQADSILQVVDRRPAIFSAGHMATKGLTLVECLGLDLTGEQIASKSSTVAMRLQVSYRISVF